MKIEYYFCTRLRLLDFLLKKGFKVQATLPNARNPQFKCWMFDRTPDLLAAVDEFYNNLPA